MEILTPYGTVAEAGIQGFPGFSPSQAVDADRDSYGAYVDAEYYVTPDFLIAGALRYEDYDIAGDNIPENCRLATILTMTSPCVEP